jgi:O-antigen/teichoic acid export membrane protein
MKCYYEKTEIMKVNQIITNTIWFGIVPKLSAIIAVIILPFATPYLTAADYGIVGIVTSYSAIFYSIYTLGLNVHLTNSYYEYKNKFNLVWGRILMLLLISGMLSFVMLSITLSIVLSDLTSRALSYIITIVSIPLLFGANSLLANHLYPLRYDPKKLVAPILFSNIIGILISFILIKYFKLGYIGILSSSAISSFLAFIFFLKPIWITEKIVPIIDLNKTRIKKIFRISIPVIPHTLGFMLLTSSDRIIMSVYKTPLDEVGYYTHGYSMGDYITVISAALITALAPRIQELYRSLDFVKLKRVYILSQVFTTVTVFLFAIWIPEIYKLVIKNADLQKSSSIASLICFSNIIFPLYAFMSTSAFIEKKTTKLLYLVFIPGTLNIVLNLIFIPIYGYKAAIYTTLIAYWSLLIIPLFVKFYSDFIIQIFHSKLILLFLFIIFTSTLIIAQYLSLINALDKFLLTGILLIILSYLLYKFREVFFDF